MKTNNYEKIALIFLSFLIFSCQENSFEEPAADPTVEPTEGPAKGEKAQNIGSDTAEILKEGQHSKSETWTYKMPDSVVYGTLKAPFIQPDRTEDPKPKEEKKEGKKEEKKVEEDVPTK